MRLIRLLLSTLLLVAVGCSNDEPSLKEYTVMVNVKCNDRIASPSLVRLYDYENAKNFDKSYKAMCEYGDYHTLQGIDGKPIQPTYTSDSFSGVNTFTNVKEGEYIVVVMYKPEYVTYPMFSYYGYKKISVKKDTDHKLYNFNFESGTEHAGKFTEF